MILLIPTNDGISVASDFDEASAFRYITIAKGHIKEDKLKKIETNLLESFLSTLPDEWKNSNEKIVTVITSGISNEMELNFINYNFEIILTTENNITNAVLDFLKDNAKIESDFCCMP